METSLTHNHIDLEKINEKLLKANIDWIDNKLLSFYLSKDMNEKGCCLINNIEYFLAYPFCCGVTEHYCQDKPKMVLFGQEYHGSKALKLNDDKTFDFESHEGYSPKGYQDWAIKHTKNMLLKPKYFFWQYIKSLTENFSICWNNLDKVYLGEKDKNEYLKNGKLTYDAEKVLSARYEAKGYESNSSCTTTNRSLIEREIQILSPDIVVFLVGPYYDLSLATAFGLDRESLYEYRPSLANSVRDISNVIKLKNNTGKDITVLWTYHPRSLQLYKITKESFVNEITNKYNTNKNSQ